jgi:hypothetical protein
MIILKPIILFFIAGVFLSQTQRVHAGMEISEFMAKNERTLATAAGTYADWVEIHNASGAPVDLAGWYLTDDITDLRKWQFPSTPATSSQAAGGYLIVFVDDSPDSVVEDEIHASFKLGSGGEYLALIKPDGATVAYQYNSEYPDQSADISYGIDAGTGEHAYFAVPTPGTANGQAIADTVQFSLKSGTFTAPFTLELSVDSPSADIRYTLDGSIPSDTSEIYYSGIVVSGTTCIRAQTFDAGLENGAVVSETFIHLTTDAAAFTSDLPLVILENFGQGDLPDSSGSIRQPCQVMFMEPVNGVCQLTEAPSIASRSGIKRRGESTMRNTAEKPNISLETWGEINEDSRSIKPLGLPAESDWILFAPWKFDRALMRNSFICELSNEMGHYAPRTRFVEVFINYDGGSLTANDYYGVYVLMEKIKIGSDRVNITELLPTDNAEPEVTGGYLWKKDKIDADRTYFTAAGFTNELLSVNPSDTEITANQQQWLINDINAIDAACENNTYETLIDVDSFVNAQMLTVLSQNADGNRVSTFYHKDRGELMKMGPIWDFDRSMGCDNDDRPSDPYEWNNFFFVSPGVLFIKKLSYNAPDFWMDWVDQWKELREGPGSNAAIDARIEGYRAELSTAAIRNFERWTTHIAPSEWDGKVDFFKAHVLARVNWIDEELVEDPDLSQSGGLVASGFEVSMTGAEAIYYTMDGSDPRASGGSAVGATYSAPITITQNTLLKARCWDGTEFNRAPDWPWSALTEGMFVVDPAPLAITEIMYHPRPSTTPSELVYTASDFEFIEIQNTSASSCLLVGVQLLNGVEFDLTDAAFSSLGAGEYAVLVRNPEAFKIRYPDWASRNVIGTYEGRLSDSGEKIKLGYDLTNMTALASFDYEDDWYPSTDGEGFSLVLNDSQSAASTWDSKTSWRHAAGVDGSPGMADPSLTYAPETIVINEVLSHQDTDNPGDWIELHNTTASAVDIGGWFLSDSRGDLKKYTIPAGTTVPANGYFVFTEYSHFTTNFALSEHGDSVYLSAGSGGELSEPAYRESQDFGAQARDVTFGRYIRTDGSAVFPAMNAATPGAANSAPPIGPIVVEEIMYHPPVGGYEYIRIRNTSGATVALYDADNPSNVWNVSGIDFEFPAGVELAADTSLVLIRDVLTPAQFRAIYEVPASIQIYSYTGALDNDADTIVLKKPGNPEAGTGYVPYIVVEQVKYNDSAPWPVEADGIGKLLRRINLSAYANDVANWQADTADYGPQVYVLTVHSGSGDGAYAPGTLVPVVADAAAPGQPFGQWIGNVAAITDTGSASTSLRMSGQDLVISALYTPNPGIFSDHVIWKYNDLGQDLGTAWQAADYDDAAWSEGAAQLGYDEGDEATVVGYGGDRNNKFVTTYFRRHFSVPDASAFQSLTLELLRDDGAVVYINGSEVVRDNMNAGTVDYLTLANATVNGGSEDTFYSFELSPDVLVNGDNVMAVEIHQRSLGSSDISFAARLQGLAWQDSAVWDGDVDGLYDVWEINYFGTTEGAIPEDDPDTDGSVNASEFIAGTLPDDGASFFQINSFDGSELTWTPVSGRTYSVYWSDQLGNPFAPAVGSSDAGRYSHSNTNLNGYYKVKVQMD